MYCKRLLSLGPLGLVKGLGFLFGMLSFCLVWKSYASFSCSMNLVTFLCFVCSCTVDCLTANDFILLFLFKKLLCFHLSVLCTCVYADKWGYLSHAHVYVCGQVGSSISCTCMCMWTSRVIFLVHMCICGQVGSSISCTCVYVDKWGFLSCAHVCVCGQVGSTLVHICVCKQVGSENSFQKSVFSFHMSSG